MYLGKETFHDIMVLDILLLSWCPVAVFPSWYFTTCDLFFGERGKLRHGACKGRWMRTDSLFSFQHVGWSIGSLWIQEVCGLALLTSAVLDSGQVSSG